MGGWVGDKREEPAQYLRIGHCWQRSLRLRYRKRTTIKLFCLIIVISALLENLRLSCPERGGAAGGMSHILIAEFILVLDLLRVPRFATSVPVVTFNLEQLGLRAVHWIRGVGGVMLRINECLDSSSP